MILDRTKIKYNVPLEKSPMRSLMTQYLPGDWLWNFLGENILCDENGVHLFPWKQTLSPSVHRILSRGNLVIRPRIYLF